MRVHDRGFFDRGGRGFGRGRFGPLLRNDRFSNLHNFETNARVRGGFSGLSGDHFGRGAGFRPTAVNPGAFRGGKIMTGNLPVVPSRESLSASGRIQAAGSGAARSVGNGNQRFFGKNPVNSRPEPFNQQASKLQSSIQRDGKFSPVTAENRGGGVGAGAGPASGARVTGTERAENNNRPETNSRVVGSASPENRGGATNDRPVGGNGSGNTTQRGVEQNTRPGGNTNNGGWHSFGQPGAGSTRPSAGNRPTLNMNKPIVTQRPNGGFGNSRPGGAPAPTYRPPANSGARPTYSAPAPSRPTYNAPSRPTYSAPSRPTYNAPSRPAYNAPRPSAPSYSAPRQSAPSRPSYSAPHQSAPSRAPSGGGSHAPSGGGSHGGSGGGGGHSHK